MLCLVGIDDTDSPRGYCTTYLAYRIAKDLRPECAVLPYPRLVRLNPNIPFKTRGNAAVCLKVETRDPDSAFERLCATTARLSDEKGGANTGLVFLDDPALAHEFEGLYLDALRGVVNAQRARRLLSQHGLRFWTQGNGMGLVGACAALSFDERFDHTYELISYRREENWGTARQLAGASVRAMDAATFPHTFNNYDYQKKKVLVSPHGPDPVFAGVRGDSPAAVISAFRMLEFEERLDGHMVYVTNQHTEAHLARELDWKVFSAGWSEGKVLSVEVGPGGHVYFVLQSGAAKHLCAVYEPTGDLRRVAKRLRAGDAIRAYGGVRKPTSIHPKILNVEKLEMLRPAPGRGAERLVRGTYVSSPRANRHLTKPLIRYGKEIPGKRLPAAEGWLAEGLRRTRALARSR